MIGYQAAVIPHNIRAYRDANARAEKRERALKIYYWLQENDPENQGVIAEEVRDAMGIKRNNFYYAINSVTTLLETVRVAGSRTKTGPLVLYRKMI